MWTAMSLPLSVPVPIAAANRLSAGVPRKFQLYSQLRNLDLGHAAEQKQQIWKKSQTKHLGYTAEQEQKQIWKKSQTKHRQEGTEEQVEEKQGDSKKLSGFDILQALEKATARKMKKKRNGRDSSLLSSRKVIEQGRKGTPEDEALADYGNKIVPPFNIKEDWGNRLDELEKKLEQLVDSIA